MQKFRTWQKVFSQELSMNFIYKYAIYTCSLFKILKYRKTSAYTFARNGCESVLHFSSTQSSAAAAMYREVFCAARDSKEPWDFPGISGRDSV